MTAEFKCIYGVSFFPETTDPALRAGTTCRVTKNGVIAIVFVGTEGKVVCIYISGYLVTDTDLYSSM